MSQLSPAAVVAVAGAGAMGSGIAQVAASAGHTVLLFDSVAAAPVRARQQIDANLARLVDRGRLDAARKAQIIGRITPCDTLAQLGPAELVIEAIIEDLTAKRALFAELESICRDTTIFASNSSSISITAIASTLHAPQRFLGMHFFNPATIMQLVEVISGLATDATVAETVFATARAWGKRPVHARSTPGFIVNRVARPFYGEALRALQEGAADAPTIDAVLKQSGRFRMGPFELMDLIGNDINYAVTCSVFDAYYQDPRYTPSLIQKELNDAGRLGRKSGRGHYDYRQDVAQPLPLTADAALPPTRVAHGPVTGLTASILELITKISLPVLPQSGLPENVLEVAGIRLQLTDGRSATQIAAETGHANVALLDLALDYASAERIALARADQSHAPMEPVIGLFQALGKAVSVIDDYPGMIVMRTVCMLANEGADAVNQRICSATGVDEAMQAGVNYPRGPMAWADLLGLAQVQQVLDNLNAYYREPRYRTSPLIRRKCLAGTGFYPH